jgi:Zn finger protein HypA/HybF involved in hydrogenase expression
MHISQFANKLRCQHCGKIHGTKEWPVNGDHVPFYFQDEPGKYTLTVNCPHCGKNWYVVWDNNPGSGMPLLF